MREKRIKEKAKDVLIGDEKWKGFLGSTFQVLLFEMRSFLALSWLLHGENKLEKVEQW